MPDRAAGGGLDGATPNFRLENDYRRDRLTWLTFITGAYFAFIQSTLGPLIPFLRTDLALSYAAGGLHLSCYAGGGMIIGLLADRLGRQFGRRVTLWGGLVGLVLGTILLIGGRSPWLTLPGVFLMGATGLLVSVTTQAILAQRHHRHYPIAVSESAVVGTFSFLLAPPAIGLAARLGDWRWALIVAIALLPLLFFRFWRIPIPAPPPPPPPVSGGGGLPGRFWLYGGSLFLCTAAEWCISFWAADFLAAVVGLPLAAASSLIVLFSAAMFLARIIGSGLARRFPIRRMLLISQAATLLTFPLFWLGPVPALALAGLFVTGFCIANLYPLTIAIATALLPGRADTAAARLTFVLGLASLSIPLLLGSLGDRFGLRAAYGLIPPLLLAALVLVAWDSRRATAAE